MRYKGEVQYIRYYATGTEARKLEHRAERKTPQRQVKAARKPVKKITLFIDPYAVLGTVAAVVMMVCVMVGFFRLNSANQSVAALESHIAVMQAENRQLRQAYEEGYDLEQVQITADALGLVPASQVQHLHITVQEPVKAPQPTFWQQIWADLQELFA